MHFSRSRMSVYLAKFRNKIPNEKHDNNTFDISIAFKCIKSYLAQGLKLKGTMTYKFSPLLRS